MSASGTGCTCPPKPGNSHHKAWVCVHYRCNHSAFNGGRRTPSDYSEVSCTKCGHIWRTKAKYVMRLHELTPAEFQLWCRRELRSCSICDFYDHRICELLGHTYPIK